MKVQTARLPSKKVINRDFKNLNEKAFLEDFKLKKLSRKSDNSNENYEFLSYKFQFVVHKMHPSKPKLFEEITEKNLKENKTLRKYFYNRSVLRNKFLKDCSDSNWQKYQMQKNKRVKIRIKRIKEHFKSITRHGIMTKRKFLATIRAFF